MTKQFSCNLYGHTSKLTLRSIAQVGLIQNKISLDVHQGLCKRIKTHFSLLSGKHKNKIFKMDSTSIRQHI